MVTKNIGMLCLGIYLIIVGASSLIPAMAGLGMIASVLALIAGIFILLGK